MLAAAFPNCVSSSPTLFLPLLFLVGLPSFFFAPLLVPLPLSQPPGRAQNGSPTFRGRSPMSPFILGGHQSLLISGRYDQRQVVENEPGLGPCSREPLSQGNRK